ncbi:4-hydroxytryptamine kinase [Frankliniella fusca]|uniref:4-hydroxytryptamine kinase n=1 Tax=Frankliniella fusca TaxID=407009 RepID=A0AAE1I3E1_9NEOP|nr:4-hydroxytryptamine kinase [Frankliniella fusca]
MPEMAGTMSNGDGLLKDKDSDVANNNVSLANGDAVNGNNGPPPPGPGPNVSDGTSDWIDAALVAEAVGADPSAVRDLEVEAAVAAGDNYCSCMWRVRARVGDRAVSLIVKAPPRGELMQDFVTRLGFFTKETRMLKETLPAMRALAERRCGPDHILAQQMGPTSLPCSVPGVLVMEDLSLNGFRNKERQPQLDMVHCKRALEMLARYHALSVALHREDPAAVEDYGEPLYLRHQDPQTEEFARMHNEAQLAKFAGQVDVWEGTKGKGYGEKMLPLSKHIYDNLCDLVAPSPTGINVLNHGDFWINNMMFTYDADDVDLANPKDVRLIDLQLVRFSSPALDLQYFIVTSCKQEVREERLDELLQTYCDHFNEYTSALGLEDARWTLGKLRDEFLSKSLFGFAAVYTVMCAVVADPEDRLQVDNIKKEDMANGGDVTSKAWAGKNYQRILPGVLEFFARAGVLD